MRDVLSAWTTIGIGGKAESITVVRSREKLIDCAPGALVLGRGSNVLVSDDGYPGDVVINRYDELVCHGVLLTAGSGARLSNLCAFARECGLTGLEWAVGIPGTVGGAVRMNAGAFGADISGVLVYADVLSGGKLIRYGRKDLDFGYRHSKISKGDTVISAAFGLRYDDKTSIKKREEAYSAARRQKQPIGRSAGSVFKNPPGVHIGKVLDELGFKGMRKGGAVFSPRHANIIVNTGGATARDVRSLIETARAALKDKGIAAEEEIVYIGD